MTDSLALRQIGVMIELDEKRSRMRKFRRAGVFGWTTLNHIETCVLLAARRQVFNIFQIIVQSVPLFNISTKSASDHFLNFELF